MKNAFLPFYDNDEELYFKRVFSYAQPLISDKTSPSYDVQQKSLDIMQNESGTEYNYHWTNERFWVAPTDIKINSFGERTHRDSRNLSDYELSLGRTDSEYSVNSASANGPYFNLEETGDDTFDVKNLQGNLENHTPFYGLEDGGVTSERPDKVVMLVFCDEASPYVTRTNAWRTNLLKYHQTDVRYLKERIDLLNANNRNFYKLCVFRINSEDSRFGPTISDTSRNTRAYLELQKAGSSISGNKFVGEEGLSEYIVGGTGAPTDAPISININVQQARVISSTAPSIPAEYRNNSVLNPDSLSRFRSWELYYLYIITDQLLRLGFENPTDSGGNETWPIIDNA
jgi:hypothetical protein